MQKLLLLGAEAVAQGAIDGGMSGIYAYPGTPSTEITEYVQRYKHAPDTKIHSQWSANEKTAVEAALGMSYAGKRAMACMKHVGLNVAADAFINSAITGANGGFIVAVADDPSMHSSQNEQDSRFYGKFAMIPMFEPANQQEAYDMAYAGFEFSEKFQIPVLIRLTTRISHSRTAITRKPAKPQNNISLPGDKFRFVLLPSIAKIQYKGLINNQVNFEVASENSTFNHFTDAADKSLGIIACGIAYNYLMEHYGDTPCPYPVLKISQYPLPRKQVEKIANECKTLLVLEDGYPFVEEQLKGYMSDRDVRGRLDGTLPRDGELNPNIVGNALHFKQKVSFVVPEVVAPRPPAMCPGCGHIDVYKALGEALQTVGGGRVFGDIGCYTLGALAPFEAINTCVDMGASITMAKGAADAGLHPAVCIIGDSTFTHSGMTGLLDAVVENTPMTVIISDNSTTGMTGQQDSHGSNRIIEICKGLGVDPNHIRLIKPLKKHHEEFVGMLIEEFNYQGLSVIIPQRECVRVIDRRVREKAKEKAKQANA